MRQRMLALFMGILCFLGAFCTLPAQGVVYTGNGGEHVRLFMPLGQGAYGVLAAPAGSYVFSADAAGVSCREVTWEGQSAACSRACGQDGYAALLFGAGENTHAAVTDSGGRVLAAYSIPIPVGAMQGLALDPQLRLWVGSGTQLSVYDASGTCLRTDVLPGAARSMAAVRGHVLIFCSGQTLLGDASLAGAPTAIGAWSAPVLSMGGDWLVDAGGTVLRFGGASLSSSGYSVPSPRGVETLAASVWGDHILYAENAQTVAVLRRSDGERVTLTAEGKILAMAGRAILTAQGTTYSVWLPEVEAAYPTPTPVPESTPIPTVSPTPEPSPTDTAPPGSSASPAPSPGEIPLPPGVEYRGTWLKVPCGVTAAQLCRSNAVEQVYSADGTAASGACRTGMTVLWQDGKILQLVVPGDCNGSGTVNSADIRALEQWILQKTLGQLRTVQEAYLLAADLDENGCADLMDLVLLARLYAEQKQ